MEYISTKEASLKWEITPTRITILANEGRIPGAKRIGRNWMIPSSAIKPQELKPHGSKAINNEKEKIDDFSFPLYHFRPDWNHIPESKLSVQQQLLLDGETALLECRFEEAYLILKSILEKPEDITVEIGSLCSIGICCVALNKPEEFSKIYLRLKLLFSEDFPHHDDLMIIFDFLTTYIETLASSANKENYNIDVDDQALPLTSMLMGYSNLIKEATSKGKADTTMMKLNLRFLQGTSANVVIEFLHIYLAGIYSLRQNTNETYKHAKAAVEIAYENKLYFPLVSYYSYNTLFLDPILKSYPKDFQDTCQKLALNYKKSYAGFLSAITKSSVIYKLNNADYPVVCGVLQGLSYNAIAKKLDIHPQTVIYRLDKIRDKLNVKNKSELIDYLNSYM